MRATLADIARQAGVSSATVDRVLNNRSGVRPRTREVVIETAMRLGYIGERQSGLDGDLREVALDVVLPAGGNAFMARLAAEFERQGAALPGVRLRVHRVDGFSPASLAARLNAIAGASDAVGIVAIDHPTVREAIRAATARGTRVITLVSDIHHTPRVGYVGIDNRSAGRLAGYLMGRLLGPGRHRIALFAGSLSYRGHEEREMGFRHILEEEFGNLEIAELSEVRDETERAYAAATAMLARHPGIAAIYNIGAGNRGIARALEEAGRAREVLFVGHDITPHTKQFLLDGTMDAVIDQNPRVEAREALAQLAGIARGRDWTMHPIRIAVLFRENIPED